MSIEDRNRPEGAEPPISAYLKHAAILISGSVIAVVAFLAVMWVGKSHGVNFNSSEYHERADAWLFRAYLIASAAGASAIGILHRYYGISQYRHKAMGAVVSFILSPGVLFALYVLNDSREDEFLAGSFCLSIIACSLIGIFFGYGMPQLKGRVSDRLKSQRRHRLIRKGNR